MSELQTHEPGFESDIALKLGKVRPQIKVVADATRQNTDITEDTLPQPERTGRREEREQREVREPVVRITENEKGDLTISVPPSMDEAKKIAAEVPRAQRAATRQKYTSMVADVAITTLMVASSIVLLAFAAKGLSSTRED